MQRWRRWLGLVGGGIALLLVGLPTITRAAGYTISDQASCQAFLTAIGASGSASYDECSIFNGTLAAGDSLTLEGTSILNPEGPPGFTNNG